MQINASTLTRTEIKQAFRRNRGAAAKLARELDVVESHISRGIKGRSNSARIDEAVRLRAAELISAERTKARGGCA